MAESVPMVGARGLTPTSKTILVRFKNLLKNVPPRCTRVVRSMCSRRTYRCLALRPWKPPRFGPSVSPSASDPMPAAVPGSGHARCLRTCGSRVRLRRLVLGRSRRGMLWFLSKRLGGLITATCGLGGPHYGEEQIAKHARWYVSRSMGCRWFE